MGLGRLCALSLCTQSAISVCTTKLCHFQGHRSCSGRNELARYPLGTGLEVLFLFPSTKRIELLRFVVSPLPSLLKSFYHCIPVPLSWEVSQMSGFYLCFLCLFDGFGFRSGLSLKQALQQGELVVQGQLALFHLPCISVFCLFCKEKPDVEQKRLIEPLRSEKAGSRI